MNCPKCNDELKEKQMDGITVAGCNHCSGVWISQSQLSQLEDEFWNDDEDKGELEFNPTSSELKCPVCNAQMIRFNYRYSDLQLDTCPDMHGFWLDKGEDEKIEEIMKEDKADFKRKIKDEEEWNKKLNRWLLSSGFGDKVKELLEKL